MSMQGMDLPKSPVCVYVCCQCNANQLGFHSGEVWIFISRLRLASCLNANQGGPGPGTKYSTIIITREKSPLATAQWAGWRVLLIMVMFGSHLSHSCSFCLCGCTLWLLVVNEANCQYFMRHPDPG